MLRILHDFFARFFCIWLSGKDSNLQAALGQRWPQNRAVLPLLIRAPEDRGVCLPVPPPDKELVYRFPVSEKPSVVFPTVLVGYPTKRSGVYDSNGVTRDNVFVTDNVRACFCVWSASEQQGQR